MEWIKRLTSMRSESEKQTQQSCSRLGLRINHDCIWGSMSKQDVIEHAVDAFKTYIITRDRNAEVPSYNTVIQALDSYTKACVAYGEFLGTQKQGDSVLRGLLQETMLRRKEDLLLSFFAENSMSEEELNAMMFALLEQPQSK